MPQIIALVHAATDAYGVSFPDLPGCITQGETLKDAIINAAEAIDLHIEGLLDDIPVPRPLDALRADPEFAEEFASADVVAIMPLPPPDQVAVSMPPIYILGILDGQQGTYGVRIPDVAGCHGGGATMDEAIQDAISALCEMTDFVDTAAVRDAQAIIARPESAFDAEAGESLVLLPVNAQTR